MSTQVQRAFSTEFKERHADSFDTRHCRMDCRVKPGKDRDGIVTEIATICLTSVPISVISGSNLAHRKDFSRRHRLTERERFPRAAARHLRSRAASGKRPAGMMTGLRLGRWTGTGRSG